MRIGKENIMFLRSMKKLALAAGILVLAVTAPATVSATDLPLDPTGVLEPVRTGVSPVLRDMDLAALRARSGQAPGGEPRELNPANVERPARVANAPAPTGPVDPVVQTTSGPNAMPPAIMNFEGVGEIDFVVPPDANGDVGVQYYVQWVNFHFDVLDKTTGVSAIGGPVPGNSLWTGLGGSCETSNDGDPIVLYDHMAGRWLMSQLTSDKHQCIAVSQTGDPTGAWYLYDYLMDAGQGYSPDQPKLGIWPDGYYYAANTYAGGSFLGSMTAVFERDKMLSGQVARLVWFYTPDSNAQPSRNLLPADLDGVTLPPTGEANPFAQLVDDAWGYDPPYDQDEIVILPLHVDWTDPSASTLGPAEIVDLTGAGYGFDSNLCEYSKDCLPQPGTSRGLDAVANRLMYRLQYRNFGSHGTLIATHTVDADGTDHAGVRWYELQKAGSAWNVRQGATYAPDGENRWIPDAAMDASGNLALGYSVASSTVYPGIRWAARLATDPPGTLPQGEGVVASGAGYQTNLWHRWGDYSSMSVDPVDDCTYWYTQEYLPEPGSGNWHTRIASFKFPGCTAGPSGILMGTVTASDTGQPLAGGLVTAHSSSIDVQTSTGTDGGYVISLPADTYSVTAIAYGHLAATVGGVVVGDGQTITQDFVLDPAQLVTLDGTVTDGGGHGWPLYAKVVASFNGAEVESAFTDPFTGGFSMDLPQSAPYELSVTELYPGYQDQNRSIVLPTSGGTENFQLLPDPAQSCTAPGYTLACCGLQESFDRATFPPPGWTVTDEAGVGLVWSSVAASGEADNWVGTGGAASASSWASGTPAWETHLRSPLTDLSAVPQAMLDSRLNYFSFGHDNGSSYEGGLLIDLSADGGVTWTNVLSWTNENHGLFRVQDSGETVNLDVSSVVGGSSQAQVRFVYWGFGPVPQLYAQVDDVLLGAPSSCAPVPGGLLAGFVTDASSSAGVAGASVANDVGAGTFSVATPDDPALDDGFYWLFTQTDADTTRSATASDRHRSTQEVTLQVVPDAINRVDFGLDSGWLAVTPTVLTVRLYPGQTANQQLTVTNNGTMDAAFDLRGIQRTPRPVQPARPEPQSVVREHAPRTAGDIIQSWPSAMGSNAIWGLAYDAWRDLLWITSPGPATLDEMRDFRGDSHLHAFTRDGRRTGTAFPFTWDPWVGPAGSTYDVRHDTVWVANFWEAAPCLREIDPVDGVTGNVLCPDGLSGEAQSVAFDPVSDTFFVGNRIPQNTDDHIVIYRFDRLGTLLSTLPWVSGNGIQSATALAFNPASGHLFALQNGASPTIYVFDPDNDYAIVRTFAAPPPPNYMRGMTMDCQGHLWLSDAGDFSVGGDDSVIEIESGESGDCLAAVRSWFVPTPESGTIQSGGGALTINAHFIADGAPHWGLVQGAIHVGNDTPYAVDDITLCLTKAFNDIPAGFWADAFIHSLAGAGITSGCGGGNFCPGNPMTRAQMAVFLLAARHGAGYRPPACTGIFDDLPCPGHWAADWAEELYNEGITAGCGVDPLIYCPDASVSRAQMAVFLLAAKEGTGYTPPPCAGTFDDVPCPGHWAADWVEELYNRGITAGCNANPPLYCPDDQLTRAQMAVFMAVNWDLPMCNSGN